MNQRKNKICKVTGLEIIEPSKWHNIKLTDKYIISFRKIGNQIVDVHGNGRVNDFDSERFSRLIDRFVEEENVSLPFVEIRNYEDLSGLLPPRDTIHHQKKMFIEKKDERVGFIAYNANPSMKYLLQSGKRQYDKINFSISYELDYSSAVKKALEFLDSHKYPSFQNDKKRVHRISQSDIEYVSMLSGKFIWDEDDIFDLDSYKIAPDHPLYSIIQNLYIAREEVLNLEAESVKQSQDLAREKNQTSKIVEALQSGILIVDIKRDEIIDINPAACLLLKGSKEQLIGKVFDEFIKDKTFSKYKHMAIKGTAECEIIDLKGQAIPVLRSQVVIELNGKNYRLENFVDMSDAKAHEERLEKSLAHTKQLNNLTFNREKRIIEMKEEVNQLLEELGRPPRYNSVIKIKEDRGKYESSN